MNYRNILSIVAYAASVSAGVIQARDSDAQLTVTSFVTAGECSNGGRDYTVYDKTGLGSDDHICYGIGVVSAPTKSILITGGSGFTNNNCYLRLFSDDACTQALSPIGPIMESNGYPYSPSSCITATDPNTGETTTALGMTLTC